MNLINYSKGFILANLVANIYCDDNYYYVLIDPVLNNKVTRPYYFAYTPRIDFLIMEISLKNIEPSVTNISVIYQPDTLPKDAKVITDTKKGEAKFMILKRLETNRIIIDVVLYNRTGLCSTTITAVGRAEETLHKTYYGGQTYFSDKTGKYYHGSAVCLAPSRCEIVVDVKNLCKDQIFTKNIECEIKASQFICTMSNPRKNWYKLYQTYDKNIIIGDIPMSSRITIKLTITLELFDNNTSVFVVTTENWKKIGQSDDVLVKGNDNIEDYKFPILKYSDATDVQFSCQEYEDLNIQNCNVGFINTKNNKIKTYNQTSIQSNQFKMADNGTILCCLYYITKEVGQEEMHMERIVDKKTILIYQPTSITNLTENQEETTSNPQINWLMYWLTTSIGIFILMVLLFIIVKKRCCTNSHPADETLEMEYTAPQDPVLYADLEFMNNANPTRRQNEQSHYANIVGVLHPL